MEIQKESNDHIVLLVTQTKRFIIIIANESYCLLFIHILYSVLKNNLVSQQIFRRILHNQICQKMPHKIF